MTAALLIGAPSFIATPPKVAKTPLLVTRAGLRLRSDRREPDTALRLSGLALALATNARVQFVGFNICKHGCLMLTRRTPHSNSRRGNIR